MKCICSVTILFSKEITRIDDFVNTCDMTFCKVCCFVSRSIMRNIWTLSVLKNVAVSNSRIPYIGRFMSPCNRSLHINSSKIQSLDIDMKNNPDEYLSFSNSFDEESKEIVKSDMVILNDFLLESEEKSMIEELNPYMKRLRYEFSHWDDAIHGYRETERLKWNENNTKIINRVRSLAFPNADSSLTLVHVLDLAEDGYIKPHIDSVRFCGNIIAGLSLLSDSVMRLVHDKEKEKVVDVFLKRRSLYIMRDCARYDYTHEILSNSLSFFKGNQVKKTRRISVICRNSPKKED